MKPGQLFTCGNCDQLKPYFACNRCQACYVYRRKHDRERPRRLFKRDRASNKALTVKVNELEAKLKRAFKEIRAMKEQSADMVQVKFPKKHHSHHAS